MKKILTGIFCIFLIPVIFLCVSNISIKFFSRNYVYEGVEDVPKRKVGLVLGTSKYLIGGGINHFYKYRMETAYIALMEGKVEYLILSGDNSQKEYNEPARMKKTLLKMGVPPEKLVLDYAGFRTLDSVIRAEKVFGQESYLVISQKFQNERAVYIGRKRGIDVVALNARDPKKKSVYLREIFAKAKAFLDVNILNTQPKFLGEKIEIGDK
ncbi:ElyC/SanA/YdcF family protein [uncultured Ilyobacter sp.]|uniref:SanA/YdcF family protein n=1 Tax=uncultured Ilyobacter sp. TaxID=544433 RepID=UPI0029C66B56|nr:ElyC/SanA/YdcF family protein [uncultured Ilyobacter sp.]